MDQEKIGLYISEKRKKKKLTQKDLAEKLGVTSKSVSRWENGKCMPDLSLFKPLCKELDISINELMSGEDIKETEYKEKLEENIIKITKYKIKYTKKQRIIIAIETILLLIIIPISLISLFNYYTQTGPTIYNVDEYLISKKINKYITKMPNFKYIKDKVDYETMYENYKEVGNVYIDENKKLEIHDKENLMTYDEFVSNLKEEINEYLTKIDRIDDLVDISTNYDGIINIQYGMESGYVISYTFSKDKIYIDFSLQKGFTKINRLYLILNR